MFNSLIAIRSSAGPFEWSGSFDIMPTASEVETWLGIDGTLTTDLGNQNHHWEFETLTDTGVLAAAIFNLIGFGTPQRVLDADYALGAAGNRVFQLDSTTDAYRTTFSAGNMLIPNPQDGTKSFLLGCSFTPSSTNDGGPTVQNRSVMHKYYNSTAAGWYLYFLNDIAPTASNRYRMLFTTDWNGANPNQSIISSFVFTYDIPVFVMAIADFAESKLKLIVAQGATIQYDEAALSDTGDFSGDREMSFGDPVIISGWDACYGKIGNGFSFEWSSAVASGISSANVTRYLKYTDGVLP